MSVVLNTFPRKTRINGEAYDPARLVAWDDGTIRLYATFNGKPVVALEGHGTWEQTSAGVSVTLDTGEEFTMERRPGCGCGHVLKRWPYEGLPA